MNKYLILHGLDIFIMAWIFFKLYVTSIYVMYVGFDT